VERERERLVQRYTRKMGRLREEIEAAESDSTPQAEVNAAVRAISARQRAGLGR
jgi:hypothetical protein